MDSKAQAIAQFNKGAELVHKGDIAGAVQQFEAATKLDPAFFEAAYYLGLSRAELGDANGAANSFRRATEINPQHASAQFNLGRMLEQIDQLDAAEAAYRQSLNLDPNLLEGLNNLGGLLVDRSQFDEAETFLTRALARDPNSPEAMMNRGILAQKMRRLGESETLLRNVIQLKPDFAEAHWNLAWTLLMGGKYEQGWEEYEWRWQWRGFPSARHRFAEPQWEGEDLHGKTIFVHTEQGFGDAIQFARYLPLLAERGAKVILGCQQELRELLGKSDGVSAVAEVGRPLPPFDFHIPVGSLPRIFKTRLDSIPSKVPYVAVDERRVSEWKTRIRPDDEALQVGLVWAGAAKPDPGRSVGLGALAPLGAIPGVRFHSLQVGKEAANIRGAAFEITDHSSCIQSFADTAAICANLDLIITIDTAVAHLAGAMGRPTWTLLPYSADWRWLLDREDNPWYPTMRLFRQNQVGDWNSVIARVAGALGVLASK